MHPESRLQQVLPAIFLALLWWICGVLCGALAAFLMYAGELDGSTRDWPPIVVFVAFTLGLGGFGTLRSWQLYLRNMAEN